jgi:DNA-directed RNA polymerase subunit L
MIVAVGVLAAWLGSGCTHRCSCKTGNNVESQDAAAACALSDGELRSRQVSIKALLAERVEAWHELPDGFAFQLPGDDETARDVLQTILLERECCTFVAFTLAFEPDHGALRLEMRMATQDKQILRDLLEPAGVLAAPPSSSQ